jgi:hypothetical protein
MLAGPPKQEAMTREVLVGPPKQEQAVEHPSAEDLARLWVGSLPSDK